MAANVVGPQVKQEVNVDELQLPIVSLSHSQTVMFEGMNLLEMAALTTLLPPEFVCKRNLYSHVDDNLTLGDMILLAHHLTTNVIPLSDDFYALIKVMARVRDLMPTATIKIKNFDISTITLPTKVILGGNSSCGADYAIYDMVMSIRDKFEEHYVYTPREREHRMYAAHWTDEANILSNPDQLGEWLQTILDKCNRRVEKVPVAIALHELQTWDHYQHPAYQSLLTIGRHLGISVFESSVSGFARRELAPQFQWLGLIGHVSRNLAESAYKTIFNQCGFANLQHFRDISHNMITESPGRYLLAHMDSPTNQLYTAVSFIAENGANEINPSLTPTIEIVP